MPASAAMARVVPAATPSRDITRSAAASNSARRASADMRATAHPLVTSGTPEWVRRLSHGNHIGRVGWAEGGSLVRVGRSTSSRLFVLQPVELDQTEGQALTVLLPYANCQPSGL